MIQRAGWHTEIFRAAPTELRALRNPIPGTGIACLSYG
jgi:hypothetical protein